MEEISKNPEKEQGAGQKENFDEKAKKSFWSSYVQKEIENAINPLAQFTKDKEKDSKENVQPTKEEILDKLFDIMCADECADVVAVNVPVELSEDEKAHIKEETGWSDKIIDNISNMKQYEVLKNAGLKEVEINGKPCLVKENIDLDYTDKDGISNADRIARGLPPIDKETGKPIELHHLGQKADSPLVELTEKEHRTGDYENGLKNQSLWHNNAKDTEVHGDGNNWDKERKEYWKERSSVTKGGDNNE